MTAKQNDAYLNNVDQMEPNLSTVWGQNDCAVSSQATAQISIAISLKRIADALEAANYYSRHGMFPQ